MFLEMTWLVWDLLEKPPGTPWGGRLLPRKVPPGSAYTKKHFSLLSICSFCYFSWGRSSFFRPREALLSARRTLLVDSWRDDHPCRKRTMMLPSERMMHPCTTQLFLKRNWAMEGLLNHRAIFHHTTRFWRCLGSLMLIRWLRLPRRFLVVFSRLGCP